MAHREEIKMARARHACAYHEMTGLRWIFEISKYSAWP